MKNVYVAAALVVVVVILIIARLETKQQESMTQLCIDLVERQYTYLHNKSCDPSSDQLCEISPELLEELDQWKEEQGDKCLYKKKSFKKV